MTRNFALSIALRRLDEEIDCFARQAAEYPLALSHHPKGSPEREAFDAEFLQCFDDNEDIFLEMPYVHHVSTVAYWYWTARADSLRAYRMLRRHSTSSYQLRTIVSYVIEYGLRQGPLALLPDDGKEEP